MAIPVGPTLPCPKCRRTLDSASWRDATHARCRPCEMELEFRRFPAFDAAHSVVKPQAVVLGEEATCFFHATNQASAVCHDCGRLLCPVCSVPQDQVVLCPACIANRRKTQAQAVKSRFLWGGAAFTMTVVPAFIAALGGLGAATQEGREATPLAVLGIMAITLSGMFGVVAAPTAVSLALIGWNKPGSILGPRRWQHVIGLVLGLLGVGGLVLAIVAIATK